MSDDKKKHLLAHEVEAMNRVDMGEGLRVEELQIGDVVTIVTENHRYELTLIDPKEHRVSVVSTNPEFFSEPATITVHGSSLGGTRACITGWIGLGYRLLLSSPARPWEDVMLSSALEIHLNGFKVLPHDGGTIH